MRNRMYKNIIYTRTLHCSHLQLIKEPKRFTIKMLLKGKLFSILYVTYLSLSVNILLLRPAQTEMVAGPHETLQMGQLVHTVGHHIQTVKCHKNVRGNPVGFIADTPQWYTIEQHQRKGQTPLHSSAVTDCILALLPLARHWFNILFACFSRLKSITSTAVYLLDSSVHLFGKMMLYAPNILLLTVTEGWFCNQSTALKGC